MILQLIYAVIQRPVVAPPKTELGGGVQRSYKPV